MAPADIARRVAQRLAGLLDPNLPAAVEARLQGAPSATDALANLLLTAVDLACKLSSLMPEALRRQLRLSLGAVESALESGRDQIISAILEELFLNGGAARMDTTRSFVADTAATISGAVAAAPKREPQALPPRYLVTRCPQTVALRENIEVKVRVVLSAPSESAPHGTLRGIPPEGAEIRLVLRAPGFTQAPGSESTTLFVPGARDSDWAIFDLTAAKAGNHELQIDAFLNGAHLGGLRCALSIVEQGATGDAIVMQRPFDDKAVDAGQVTLFIRFDDASKVYHFDFLTAENFYRSFRSERLEVPRYEANERLVASLNDLAGNDRFSDPKSMRNALIGKGLEMWRQIIPLGLQTLFWERRDRIKRMIVMADSDALPWELLYPEEPNRGSGAAVSDTGFLAEQFPIARWCSGLTQCESLSTARIRCVVPNGSPQNATDEINDLQAVLGAEAQRIATLTELLQTLELGEFDLMHFACHNRSKVNEQRQPTIFMAQACDPFTPDQVRPLRGRLEATHPIVFMNACRTKDAAPSYTRMEGWAEAFLAEGAGAFIGSMWAVRDQTARSFAKAFYGELHRHEAISDALFAARLSIKDIPSDPTWLAYTVYAAPTAKV